MFMESYSCNERTDSHQTVITEVISDTSFNKIRISSEKNFSIRNYILSSYLFTICLHLKNGFISNVCKVS